MSDLPATTDQAQLQLERDHAVACAILTGDLSQLDDRQKVQVYVSRSEAAGLNWRAQPYEYLKLNGKVTLYLSSRGIAQLNGRHKVSHQILSRETILEEEGEVYRVTARAYTLDGRSHEAMAEVLLFEEEEVTEEFESGNKKLTRLVKTGQYVPMPPLARSNARMKCETKAKARATKMLVGEAAVDEYELDSIPNAQVYDGPQPENGAAVKVEVEDPKPVPTAAGDAADIAVTSNETAQKSVTPPEPPKQTRGGNRRTSTAQKGASSPTAGPTETPSAPPETKSDSGRPEHPGNDQLAQILDIATRSGWSEEQASDKLAELLSDQGLDVASFMDEWTWKQWELIVTYFGTNKPQ